MRRYPRAFSPMLVARAEWKPAPSASGVNLTFGTLSLALKSAETLAG